MVWKGNKAVQWLHGLSKDQGDVLRLLRDKAKIGTEEKHTQEGKKDMIGVYCRAMWYYCKNERLFDSIVPEYYNVAVKQIHLHLNQPSYYKIWSVTNDAKPVIFSYHIRGYSTHAAREGCDPRRETKGALNWR